MTGRPGGHESPIRYQADEKPTWGLSLGLAAQYCITAVGGTVLSVAIVVRSAGAGEDYLAWGAFAALVISGLTTIVQAVRIGRFGAGYILMMGTSAAFMAVAVTALAEGGPFLLTSLVVVSSLFQFALAHRLSLLRRFVTPTVAGTVLMLIAVNVMPFVFDFLGDLPEGAPPSAGPIVGLVTLAVTLAALLRFSGPARIWGPLIGVLAGVAAAGFYGILDGAAIAEAPWVGAPGGWPGFGFDFSPAFWALLPGFIFVTLVGAIETIGDSVAIQRVSWRTPRATDYRAVQGAVAADGIGNLLSGILSTVPNTTYSSSISIAEITGVAARRVGLCIGLLLCTLALLPKFAAVLLAIPNPVIGGFIMVIIAVLFMLGARIVVQDGMDYRKATIVGVSFWIGTGFQNGQIPIDGMPPILEQMLSDGMTVGGLTALLLTAFAEFAGPRRKRIDTTLEIGSLERIRSFLEEFSRSRGLATDTATRLTQAAEETILLLIGEDEDDNAAAAVRKLRLTVAGSGGSAELEFLASGAETNIEDQLAVIEGHAAAQPEQHEFSLRLLRHLASSVRHHRYQDIDIVTLRVDAVETGPRQGPDPA